MKVLLKSCCFENSSKEEVKLTKLKLPSSCHLHHISMVLYSPPQPSANEKQVKPYAYRFTSNVTVLSAYQKVKVDFPLQHKGRHDCPF